MSKITISGALLQDLCRCTLNSQIGLRAPHPASGPIRLCSGRVLPEDSSIILEITPVYTLYYFWPRVGDYFKHTLRHFFPTLTPTRYLCARFWVWLNIRRVNRPLRLLPASRRYLARCLNQGTASPRSRGAAAVPLHRAAENSLIRKNLPLFAGLPLIPYDIPMGYKELMRNGTNI